MPIAAASARLRKLLPRPWCWEWMVAAGECKYPPNAVTAKAAKHYHHCPLSRKADSAK